MLSLGPKKKCFKIKINRKLKKNVVVFQNRLLSAIRTREQYLTPEQRERNSHGPCYLYKYTPEQQGTYRSPMPQAFPDIAASRAK
jgi:5'-3' exonuclease